ncbi:MAG: conjugal transfer protein TraO, partial [Emticicia sp.]|uniref:conjugal transfer protein TraO n=1 Tax=Emticicia sp. TaxID=1930953 RepID=UPI003BA4F5B2
MKSFIILLLLGLCQFSNAQVHLKKQLFYELALGSYDNYLPSRSNVSLLVSFGRYNRKGNAHAIGFNFNRKQTTVFDTQTNKTLSVQVPVQQLYLSYKTDFSFYSNAMNNFHVKGIGRVNVGYESLNQDRTTLENTYQLSQKSDFLLGVGAGLEVEYSPVVLGVHQNINVLSSYQKFSSITFLGFRF